jgi:cell wall-associated NlpC family hydrolase
MRMVEATKEYIGVPYKLGGCSKDGFDCFWLIVDMIKKQGKSLPEDLEIGKYNLANYTKLFSPDTSLEERKLVITGFFQKYFDEIEPGQAFIGDVALLELRDMIAAGILVGNDNVMLMFETSGVKIIPMNKFKVDRWRFFRCR